MTILALFAIISMQASDPSVHKVEAKPMEKPASSPEAEQVFAEAVQSASRGNADSTLGVLLKALEAGACPTRVLSEPAFLFLHERPEFRNQIRRFAKQSETTLVVSKEPGTPMHVSGRVVDAEGAPIPGARLYVFQTGASGSYSTGGGNAASMGDSLNPRIFGFLVTGADGSYAFKTIRPGQYPGDGPPAHIHFEVRARGYEESVTELMFKDDSKMNEETIEWVRRAGFGICEPEPSGDGGQKCGFEIKLRKKSS